MTERAKALPTRLALVLMLAIASRVGGDDVPQKDSRETPQAPSYRIGPEDVLQISVWRNDALSRVVPVRPDGMISLPLVNDVRAAGLTPMELRSELIARLGEYSPAPEVSVIVSEVHSFKVSVVGAVAKAGRFDIRSSVTVLDALALAGGFTEFANPSRVVVLRPQEGKTRRITFDCRKLSEGPVPAAGFYLQPGDIVVVP